jgi:tetratricopeptide (TPR) repeat protein
LAVFEFPTTGEPGTLLRWDPTGQWFTWLPATGSIELAPVRVALIASDADLSLLAVLPRMLGGLSVRGLPVTDEDLAAIAHRLIFLRWLDLRGTLVTPAGLRVLGRLWLLRRIGVDHPVARSGSAPFARVTVGGAEPLVVVEDRTPVGRPAQLQDLLAEAAAESNGPAPRLAVASALGRAEVLADAGRPFAALAVLAPVVSTENPAILYSVAHLAWIIGRPAAALAALDRAPPQSATSAWRAVILAASSPYASLAASGAALREDPHSYLAHWARCIAFIAAGQRRAAAQALDDLQTVNPTRLDTLRMAAQVASAAGQHRKAVEAWSRVLAQRPDDADALSGLSEAHRRSRPWSMAWAGSLLRATGADATRGAGLLRLVTKHRRGVARGTATIATVASGLVLASMPAMYGKPAGLPFAIGILLLLAVAGTVWVITPVEVRRMIRRVDDLTGSRRAPDWRRIVLALAVAGAALAVPAKFAPVGCDALQDAPCYVVPRIPTFSPPTLPFIPPATTVGLQEGDTELNPGGRSTGG